MKKALVNFIFVLLIFGKIDVSTVLGCPTGSITVTGNISKDVPVSVPGNGSSFEELASQATASAIITVYDTANIAHSLYFYVYYLGSSQAQLMVFGVDSELSGGAGGQSPQIVAETIILETAGVIPNTSEEILIFWQALAGERRTVVRLRLNSLTFVAGASSFNVSQNGSPNVCPRAARLDFDGDGIDDPTIFRPEFGYWAIRLSSTSGTNGTSILWKQWGLPGDYPMPGDYTGDGLADLVVWRSENGNWYTCESELQFNCTLGSVQQFGLPGDRPIQADYDGDGVLDYIVWRPNTRQFYYKSSKTGVGGVYNWGLPSDIPLQSGNNR